MDLAYKVIFILLLTVYSAFPATYYVSLDGNNTWTGTASNYVSGTTGPWRNLWKAADVVSAGDTVYVRGGNYGVDYYDPNGRAGTAENPIILTNYPGEIPIIAGVNGGATYALDLKYGANYHKVYGLTITNCGRTARIQSSHYNEIAYCNFGPAIQEAPTTVSQLVIFGGSQSNWIHHCVMFGGGLFSGNTWESGHVIEIGAQVSSPEYTYFNSYNLIENCHLYWGGHDVVTIASPLNIFRNNHVHNENWQAYTDQEGLWGERCIEIGGYNCYRNLIDNNLFGYSGQTESGNGGSSVTESPYNIIRRNRFIKGAQYGFQFYTKAYGIAQSNYFYNNTMFENGVGSVSNLSRASWTTHAGASVNAEPYKAALHFVTATNNIFKNNIYRNNSGNRYYVPIGGTNWMAGYISNQNPGITNSYHGNDDPLFVDPSGNNPFETNAPDLHLQSSSTMIDSGEWLTTIISESGSGTSFIVADPNYFWGGWMVKDEIQLEGEYTTRTVDAVNYETGEITLDESVTWTSGQGVSLSYVGAAPDIGAYEYGAGKTNPVITWTGSTNLTYPATLTNSATATWGTNTVEGTIAYSPTNGASLNSGTQVVTITFTPTDTNTYNSVSITASVVVAQGDPEFTVTQIVSTLSHPASFSTNYFTPASVQDAAFTYSKAQGAALNPGNNSIVVSCSPGDTNYFSTNLSFTITVTGVEGGKSSLRFGSTNAPKGRLIFR